MHAKKRRDTRCAWSKCSLSVINTNPTPIAFAVVVSDNFFVGPVNKVSVSGNRQGATTATDAPGDLVASFADVANGDADSFSFSAGGAVADGIRFGMSLLATGTLTPGAALINRGATELKRDIPEPGSLVLLGGALLGLALLRRRSFAK